MSYGHGALEDALENARQRLDICSVTGHADWPDMPQRDGRIDHIIDFHERGFAKLKAGWRKDLETMKRFNGDDFLVYPGFEIHSMKAGDYTIICRDPDEDLIYPGSIEAFADLLRADEQLRERLLPFPHHIGYKAGRRGINWESFHEELFPLVEIYSMHGCAEEDENDKPFLHTMGPVSANGTMRYGLGNAGAKFGVLGNTDHHSAHPGSYGHGFSGIWADRLDRESIWEALKNRRTFALSADKMQLAFSLNGAPMGSVAERRGVQELEFDLWAGGALDYVDIIKNGKLLARTSQPDIPARAADGPHRTVVYLELGWGERNVPFEWEVTLGVSSSEIEQVDARFRGDEVVSPLDAEEQSARYFRSSWQRLDSSTVRLKTVTRSNPTNSTPATQGIALHLNAESGAAIQLRVNGKEYHLNLEELHDGSFVDYAGGFDSPAFKLHRAPFEHELHWHRALTDEHTGGPSYYYLRARQKNGAWAWSSPVWVD